MGEMEKQGLIIIHSKDRGGGRKAAQALERCNRFAASHEDTHSVCGSLWRDCGVSPSQFALQGGWSGDRSVQCSVCSVQRCKQCTYAVHRCGCLAVTIFSERTEKSVSENSAKVCSERTEDVPRLMDRLLSQAAMYSIPPKL